MVLSCIAAILELVIFSGTDCPERSSVGSNHESPHSGFELGCGEFLQIGFAVLLRTVLRDGAVANTAKTKAIMSMLD